MRVVVEAAHEPRVLLERDADVREQPLHAREVRARLVVEIAAEQRRAIDQIAELRVLAVEDPERIALEAPQAVLVERVAVCAEVLGQHLLVARARLGRADRVELERDARDPELLPKARRERDELGVDLGLGEAERLDAELVKLPVATLLRLLAPEHRAAAPEFLLLVVQQAVAERRAHDASGRLGPQRHALAVAVVERVHLLRDDVGELADRAAEELRALEHRQANALITVGREELRGRALDALPERRVGGQHVVHAADRLNQVGHVALNPWRCRRRSARTRRGDPASEP